MPAQPVQRQLSDVQEPGLQDLGEGAGPPPCTHPRVQGTWYCHLQVGRRHIINFKRA
jgi:hypothetical protein